MPNTLQYLTPTMDKTGHRDVFEISGQHPDMAREKARRMHSRIHGIPLDKTWACLPMPRTPQPPTNAFDRRVGEARQSGLSLREVAKKLGTTYTQVWVAVARMEATAMTVEEYQKQVGAIDLPEREGRAA